MGACFCGRATRGFYFKHPTDKYVEPVACCSMKCLGIATRRRGQMEINIVEKVAVETVSPKVGEYLEKIGKTNLATMTTEEWHGFIAHTHACVAEHLREVWDDVPF
jgi:hypothetical protein